jgi:phytoene synthase
MAVHMQPWERRLLDLAQEALESHMAALHLRSDDRALNAAYAHCSAITKEHSRTFFMASGLLPPPKRRAARALYAFCRVSDNLVDAPTEPADPHASLALWRERTLDAHVPVNDLVAVAWADTRARYRIPWRYAEQLIDGVASDLGKARYADFGELAEYCYGVASTVGLMAMHIIGFAGPPAIPYAVKLGVALQLTNILRDVAEDWRFGRVYLPQDELAAFDLDETAIAAGLVTDRWRQFMRFQIERNRRFYDEALPGIALLDRDGRFAIAAAAELYRGILDDIEAHDYDVFNRRAHLSTAAKLGRLPSIWLRSRQTK